MEEIIHIGKESNKLEQSDVLGVGKEGYEFYDNGEVELSDDLKDVIFSMGPKTVEEMGITQRQWYYYKDKIEQGLPIKVPEITYNKIIKTTEYPHIITSCNSVTYRNRSNPTDKM